MASKSQLAHKESREKSIISHLRAVLRSSMNEVVSLSVPGMILSAIAVVASSLTPKVLSDSVTFVEGERE